MNLQEKLISLQAQRNSLDEKIRKIELLLSDPDFASLLGEEVPSSQPPSKHTTEQADNPEWTDHQREQNRIFREERVVTSRDTKGIPVVKTERHKMKDEKGRNMDIIEEFIGNPGDFSAGVNFDEGEFIG